MSSIDKDSRQAFINDLSTVITKGKADVNSLLSKLQWTEERVMVLSSVITKGKADVNALQSKLQWTEERVMDGPSMQRCLVNPNHMVPESALTKHVAGCQLAKERYSREEQKKITDNAWFYTDATNVVSVSIDQTTQNQILSRVSGSSEIKPVPKTTDRIESDLLPREKLAIYEHVVQKAKEVGHGSSVSLEELAFDPSISSQKEKSSVESRAALLAKQRDLKRRRQTYRAKNVHITRKSQTDIMKEIIDMQMSELEDMYKEEQRKKRRDERRKTMDDERDRRRDERDTRREVDRVRVKIEPEEGEVVDVDSRQSRRSRHYSRDRDRRRESRYDEKESRSDRKDREGTPRQNAELSQIEHDMGQNGDSVSTIVRRSREVSVESVPQERSREGSVDSSARRDDEDRRRRKKKKKSDKEHRSRHKHKKHSHDRVRVKDEQS